MITVAQFEIKMLSPRRILDVEADTCRVVVVPVTRNRARIQFDFGDEDLERVKQVLDIVGIPYE